MTKKTFRNFLREEDGMGTVEVILIIVVLIGLVIIFKTQLTQIVNNIFEKISSQSSSILYENKGISYNLSYTFSYGIAGGRHGTPCRNQEKYGAHGRRTCA